MKQMLSYTTVLLAQIGILFWDFFDGVEEYTTSVTGFINKCVNDVIPTVTVRTPPFKSLRSLRNVLVFEKRKLSN